MLRGNILFFRDVKLLDDNLPIYLAWCIKDGYFVVDPRDGHLHGPAIAPMCAPGTIDLERVPDHPRVIVPGSDDAADPRVLRNHFLPPCAILTSRHG